MEDAYAAGLFDGEGWVRVNIWEKPGSSHVRYQVLAGIGVCYRPVIEDLKIKYGGSVHMNRHDLRNPNNRIVFTWNIGSKVANAFLKAIHPHLRIKREQVDLALRLQEHINAYKYKLGNQYQSHPERDQIFSERAALAKRISELKKQAFLPTDLPLSAVAPDTTLPAC